MPKRITFQADRNSTIDAIDQYCRARSMSRSAVISQLLNSLTPTLNKINGHLKNAHDLEVTLGQWSYVQDCISDRTAPTMTVEEHFYDIWLNVIKHKHIWLGDEIHEHRRSINKMGKGEVTSIHNLLECMVDKLAVERAILIYTDRRVSYQLGRAGGLSTTLLIKQSVCNGHLFDFAHSKAMPIFDVITHGTKETLRRHDIAPPHSCVCWVPIYYINDMVVMTPVVKAGDVGQLQKKTGRVIIINPFSQEVSA